MEENLKKIQKEVDEAVTLNLAEQFIKNNEFEFEVDKRIYRIRKPTFSERQQVFEERVRLWTGMLKETTYPLESELRKLYKTRGIDIDKMEEEIKGVQKKREEANLTLGKLIAENAPEQECQLLKAEIEALIDRQTVLSTEKGTLLQYTLETQIIIQTYTYLTVLISEYKKEDGAWERVFKTLEEFKSRNEDALTSRLIMYVSLFIRHELEL